MSALNKLDTVIDAVATDEEKNKQEARPDSPDSTPHSIIQYLMQQSASNNNKKLLSVLGSPEQKQPWTAKECGDGNINYIFIVQGAAGSVVVKQAPPFIRLVGPSWQLKQQRLLHEVLYTQKVLQCSKEHAPDIYLVDDTAFLFVMEDLTASGMVVFRAQIAKAIGIKEYPNMGAQVGLMVARMLFKTSDLCMKPEEKWAALATFCANHEMVGITEQVIFEEPYFEAQQNRYQNNAQYQQLCPQMIETVNSLRGDSKLLTNVFNLRRKFRCLHQALVHGDLHTGSIMCNAQRSVAIDAEFCYYGPYFVDVGLFIGNMLLSCFSQELYATNEDDRAPYIKYLCQQTISFYDTFYANFLNLWNAQKADGNLIPLTMGSESMRQEYQLQFMNEIWTDSILFAGMILIRRTLGIADGPEFRVDKTRNKDRWTAEEKACRFGRDILNGTIDTKSLHSVIEAMAKYL